MLRVNELHLRAGEIDARFVARPVRPAARRCECDVPAAPHGGSAFGVLAGAPGSGRTAPEIETDSHVAPPSSVLQTPTGSVPAAAPMVPTAQPWSGSTNCTVPSNDGRDVNEDLDHALPPSDVRKTVTLSVSATPAECGHATQACDQSRENAVTPD